VGARHRDGVRSLLLALARTGVGRRALASVAMADPRLVIESLGAPLRARSDLAAAPEGPPRGFEDVAFLFSSSQANRGIASLDLDEAAYLWRLARGLGPATLVEIGRFRGGSTILLASAMHPESRLVSYDLHVKHGGRDEGAERDRVLRGALERLGLADRVELVVGDSRTAPQPEEACGLVFVDGDHSYAGVRGDYDRWGPKLASGGHLVLHDARAPRDLTSCDPEVARLADEIDRAQFEDVGGAGSLADFRRRS
jgi:predicted O-methyltransferase YrrM